MSRLLRDDMPGASSDYLLEEVATALGPERVSALTALSCVSDVDDALATAAADRPTTASDLLTALPLVLRSAEGSFQMHDLWRDALVRDRAMAPGSAAALSRLAEVEAERGRHLAAAELFARADDDEGFVRASLEVIGRPMVLTSASELRVLASLVDGRRQPTLSALVHSTLPMVADERTAADAFAAAAEAARAAGDARVEVVALQNELNLRATLGPHTIPQRLTDRIEDLSTVESVEARLRPLHCLAQMYSTIGGDGPEEAVRHLAGMRSPRTAFEATMLAFALSDLGRPEEVSAPDPGRGPTDAVSRMGGQYMAQAMWLRGDVPPELALELGSSMEEDTNCPALQRCSFGPAITAARDAGVALVALREAADVGPARRLPWHRPFLLRAHVLPPHLIELAAAVAEVGEDGPAEVIDQIPRARDHLLTAAARKHRPGAGWAASRAAQLAARPDHDISVALLGPARCHRGGVAVTDAGWIRRDRVRQLLAFLLLHRRIARRRAAAALWPDLPSDKAAANLRVTLTYLHKVLEPMRRPDERPWFIRTDPELIEVHAQGLEVDTETFDGLCRAARAHDDAGRGARAIATLRQAAELYRGEYAGDWPDAQWAQVERLRLHALAVSAMTRLGELLLARGGARGGRLVGDPGHPPGGLRRSGPPPAGRVAGGARQPAGRGPGPGPPPGGPGRRGPGARADDIAVGPVLSVTSPARRRQSVQRHPPPFAD